jgi:hypothetical protein
MSSILPMRKGVSLKGPFIILLLSIVICFAQSNRVPSFQNLKISGYIQAQYRTAVSLDPQEDSDGNYIGEYAYPVGEFSGGAFANDTRGIFQIRRGWLKTTFKTDLSEGVLEIDMKPEDVSVKGAYLYFSEPWLKSIGMQAGLFNVPFGFIIDYSSSKREPPERPRIFQTLFPGERDVGIGLSYIPYEKLPYLARLFNFKFAYINGAGIAPENDKSRNFVWRTGISLSLFDTLFKIDGGSSIYLGKITTTFDTIYTFDNASKVFNAEGGRRFDDITRNYFGVDIEAYFSLPVLGELTLRGEVIGGTQPGSAQYSTVYMPDQYEPADVVVSDTSGAVYTTTLDVESVSSQMRLYRRNFLGYYITYVQNIDPIKSKLVVRWDVYDPNTQVNGGTFSAGSGLTPTDVKFSTLGLGLVYELSGHIRLTGYYEFVFNEKVNSSLASDPAFSDYTKTLYDDVFTLRFQYSF